MVHRWRHIRDEAHRMYVEENRPLDEIVKHFHENYGFPKNKRTFQTVFRRWGFPSRWHPASKNQALVARIKELWEANVSAKNMLATLRDEGFQVSERDLQRIRTRNGWKLRTSVPYARDPSAINATSQSPEGEGDGEEDSDSDRDGADDANTDANDWNYGAGALDPVEAQVQEESLNAMREAQREQRRRMLEMEFYQRWLTKKRRRHTRSYGGLPPDPPGPPRFPSETTLAEAKEILQLDKDTYNAVREKFYNICVSQGVYKKTLIGPERWESLKEQLIRETMYLRAVMWDQTDMDKKKLAIEIIACDVTKRIRMENMKIKYGEAKTILGINPEQGRQLREQLYNLLALERVKNRVEDGPEIFESIKQRWIAGSELLNSVVNATSDPDHERKMKAIKAIYRDGWRRYQDDVVRKGKTPTILLPPDKRVPPKRPKQGGRKKKSSDDAAQDTGASASAATSEAPASSERETSEAAPAEAAPSQPAFSQQAPIQPAPNQQAQQTRDEPRPILPAPTQPASQSTPSQSTPAQPKRRGRPPGRLTNKDRYSRYRLGPVFEGPYADQPGLSASPPGTSTTPAAPGIQTETLPAPAPAHQPPMQQPPPPLPPPHQVPMQQQQQQQQQQQPPQTHQITMQQQPLAHQISMQQHPPPVYAARVPPPEPEPPASNGLAAFFKLSSASQMMFGMLSGAQWIAPLSSRTMGELKRAAVLKTPGAICYKIEGMVKDGRGGELPLPVSDDDELQTYLEHVGDRGAPTFRVYVVPG
ncbi:hypothetical protein VTJ04DRAFT_1823 [Mycothermus thermophilus]|uniref:uncharacterized protein n=1 Tax=Humicola insolens TaxID=85995 RepID=UPI003742D91E